MKSKKIRGRKLNKNEVRQQNNWKQIFLGGMLIVLGIIIGITLSLNGTFALETATANNATSANATSSNATASNATASNATSSNATASNATSSNATSSNVQKTDNIMYLDNLSLASDRVKVGDKVYITKSTTGACNTAMSITFKDSEHNQSFSVNVESINDNPYFIVPNYVLSGTYEIVQAFLVGTNSDNTTFTKKFGTSNLEDDVTNYVFHSQLIITGNETDKVLLNKLTLSNSSAKVGEQLNLTIDTSESLTSLKLVFKSNNGLEFVTYVNSADKNPSFTIPTTTKVGTYYLYQAILTTSASSSIYTDKDNYNFNINLEIKEAAEKKYVYNNNDITNEIIKDIYNGEDNLEVIIQADENPIISSELFNAIKGTDKKLILNYYDNQIIFCGTDIETPKSIDVSLSTNIVAKDKDLVELIQEGVVINFASNGNLPGDAFIKVKVTDEMKASFGNNKIYIYYYDEDSKGFCEISREISAKDGYYEFTINHNSKYVFTKNEIDDKWILENENNIVDFQQSNTHYLLWIGATMLLIVVVIIVVIFVKKKGQPKDKI